MEFSSFNLIFFGILGLIFWSLEYWRIFKRPQLHLSTIDINLDKKSFKAILRGGVYLLGVISWILISISLAGPRKSHKFSESEIEVNDIMFVVDLSRSMLAEDFKPNRLESAKKKMTEFVSLRPKDRIGIVIFSEKPFTLLPFTTDLKLVKKVIEEIEIGILGSGTNIGDALGLAVARSAASETKNKIIILLTDGVSNMGNLSPIGAAEYAKKMRVKVYTIGIGSDKNAKIPVANGIFGKRYQIIPGGSIDVKTLKEIAKITGGVDYLARDENALKDVLLQIEKLERQKLKVQGHVIYDELYFPFLLWGGLLLILVEILRKRPLREVV